MPPHDPPATDFEGEAVVQLEDMATLDIEASVEEVMTVVHWVEDHAGAAAGATEPAAATPRAPAAAAVSRRRPARNTSETGDL
jgi:hypothetical protein